MNPKIKEIAKQLNGIHINDIDRQLKRLMSDIVRNEAVVVYSTFKDGDHCTVFRGAIEEAGSWCSGSDIYFDKGGLLADPPCKIPGKFKQCQYYLEKEKRSARISPVWTGKYWHFGTKIDCEKFAVMETRTEEGVPFESMRNIGLVFSIDEIETCTKREEK